MKSSNSLLQQIRRKQILVCAYRPTAEGEVAPSLEEISEALKIETEVCAAMVSRLVTKGLLIRPSETERVQITERGRRLVQRMFQEVPATA